MKHLFLVENEEELTEYQSFVQAVRNDLNGYVQYLKDKFSVRELPRAILWTSSHTATTQISSIPLPAYTNSFRTVISPDLESWKAIYLRQLDGLSDNDTVCKIRTYYSTRLNQHHILQILGHELAHHSDLFLDDFNSTLSDGIWFEEGMVEYISRRYFLTDTEFEEESEINRMLVEILSVKYGHHSLEAFGASAYEGDYASIFFEYWRSFLAVSQIVDAHNGDIAAVFRSYHKWNQTVPAQSLAQWYGLE